VKHHDDELTLDIFEDTKPVTPPSADEPGLPPAPPPPADDSDADDPERTRIDLFAERAYLAYAMSVVTGRALPSVQDGQKPVQRRILFAMRELGNRSDSPHKKSARIVGDVIGKFHPHGDSSVYDAAVRMAQDFTLRYPLIDGQGNFGSRDGDGAAAMRYTEIRLTKLAEAILLSELDSDTVDFSDNYDGTMNEPALLPARLPMLLMNGAAGIAVGMATDIPPHNMAEVAAAAKRVIADPACADEAILDAVPGPDFPGGGQVISSPAEIRAAYSSGRGSLRVRARWSIEPLARGQWRVAIHELPPGTSAAKVLAEIEDLKNPKVKTGKKSLTPEQQASKAAALALIDSFRDDSDAAHPVRLLIEPQSRNVAQDELMAYLLANTSLEANTSVNLTVIGLGRKPKQASLATLIREWAEFRVDTVTRRLRHRLTQVERRIHILEGRMIVYLNIDKVIKVIRESDEPKKDLMAKFKLSDTQAEDILEIRLRQLARLEKIKIERELGELRSEQGELQTLLGDEGARRRLIIAEIDADVEKFGDARRTLLEEARKVTASDVETVVDEPVTLLISKNGFLRARNGHGIDPSSIVWKDGDAEFAVIETRTIHPLVLLDSSGRAYTVKIQDIPGGKGDGVPAASLCDLAGKKLVAALSCPPGTGLLISSSAGFGFVCEMADLVSRQKAGKAFATVEDGHSLLPPVPLPADYVVKRSATEDEADPAASGHEIAFQADDQRLLAVPLEQIKALSGGKGVTLIALEASQRMVSAQLVGKDIQVNALNAKGKIKRVSLAATELDAYRGKRGRKGRAVKG
jgi:topoisomerase-4 subunit A